MSRDGWLSCHTCVGYERQRANGPVITAAIAEQAELEGVPGHQIFTRLMKGVHERHLTGLSVLP